MIEAQDALLKMGVADYPNMKAHSRKDFYKSIHVQAYPITHSSEILTSEQLQKRIERAISG